MMNVCVGERPKPVGRGALRDFNELFMAMFRYFSENHERIVTMWHENHEEDPLGSFGSLAVASVRRWLKYYQLVTVEKQTESDPISDKAELLKKHGWSLPIYDEDWKKWRIKSWRGYDKFFDHNPPLVQETTWLVSTWKFSLSAR